MKTTQLNLRIWPDKILKKKCKEVVEVNPQIRELLNKMYVLMKEKGGIGLAANQAGLDLKLVVIDIPPFKTNKNIVFKLINPKILKKEGRRKSEEGCLSFPNLSLTIKRAERVWVEALDERGKILNLEAKGILSIVLQHEIDHINGIVFIDRLSFWERVKILPKLRKLKLN